MVGFESCSFSACYLHIFHWNSVIKSAWNPTIYAEIGVDWSGISCTCLCLCAQIYLCSHINRTNAVYKLLYFAPNESTISLVMFVAKFHGFPYNFWCCWCYESPRLKILTKLYKYTYKWMSMNAPLRIPLAILARIFNSCDCQCCYSTMAFGFHVHFD